MIRDPRPFHGGRWLASASRSFISPLEIRFIGNSPCTSLLSTYAFQVLSIMDGILSSPDQAQPYMAQWISLHITRTLVADVPAWACFIGALLCEL